MVLTDTERIARDLLKAAQMGDVETIKKLARVGGSLNTADKNGRTLLMVAVDQNRMDVFEYLLSQKANVNAATVHGWTAIDLAEGMGRHEMFERLLAAGARRTSGGVINPPSSEAVLIYMWHTCRPIRAAFSLSRRYSKSAITP